MNNLEISLPLVSLPPFVRLPPFYLRDRARDDSSGRQGSNSYAGHGRKWDALHTTLLDVRRNRGWVNAKMIQLSRKETIIVDASEDGRKPYCMNVSVVAKVSLLRAARRQTLSPRSNLQAYLNTA